MCEVGSDKKAEIAETPEAESDGITNGQRDVSQTHTACAEKTGDESTERIEEVLRQENLKRAYRTLKQWGLRSLLDEHRRFAISV